MDALESVIAAAKTKAEARALYDEADETLRDAVRTAIEARVPVVQLVNATGLTRARIYQIRDNTR